MNKITNIKKIGLCTPYKIDNYGTKLQAYAVQEKVKSFGFDVEVINYDKKSDFRPVSLYRRYLNIPFLKIKMGQLKRKKQETVNSELGVNIKIRKDAINSFDHTHYTTTNLIKGYSGLKEKSKEYSAVVCGSDQIWLPGSINMPTSTLEFAQKGCRRIAFAPSFGVSEVPKNKYRQYKKFLDDMDFISVREVNAVDLVKELCSKDATVILDPTLSVDRGVWDKLKDEGRNLVEGDYIFCYFLGQNISHRDKVFKFARKNNLKIVTLPHFKGYFEPDEKQTDIRLYDVTPCDFIKLISQARYVCTDSFHATVFSILYNKEFFTFERFSNSDKNSANSRIYSLLEQLGIQQRIVSDEIEQIYTKKIDYDTVNERLNSLRCKTDIFLKKAFDGIDKPEKKEITFEYPQKNSCCGCSACVSICPVNCLEMTQDEMGFHYPKIVNDKCIHCNQCNNVCPSKKQLNVTHSINNASFVNNTDLEMREKSSSGGIFSTIALKVLSDNGYVCGASYDKDFNVHHIIINNKSDLYKIIGSKYSESDLGDCFRQIKKLLNEGKKVVFSGTPCQARGLSYYLKKKYVNLIIIDLLCYGIQSPLAWNSYLKEKNKNGTEIKEINMRDKSESWQKYSMRIQYTNGSEYLTNKENDPYLKSYSKGLFIRPECYKCQFKAFPRVSDLTIGDFWDIDEIMPEKNDHRGAGILIVNTDCGKNILDELVYENKLSYENIDIKKLRQIHPLFCINAKRNRKSSLFKKYLIEGKYTFSEIEKNAESQRWKSF